jgi:hypothetical protein
MAHEDIKIIIRKNGEIWVDLGGLSPQKIKHYKEIFEEAIGPIKGEIISSDGGGASGAVYLTDHLKIQDTEEEGKDREKIKN